jgi:anion-transporting  ArsA/GET3 family ATPase
MTAGARSLLEQRLIFVTGKGGVGKTAVSCALAEAARRAGKRVLLIETAQIETIAGHFERDPSPLGYSGRPLRPGLQALCIEPHEALADYVRLQTGLGAVTDRVLRSDIFQQLLEAAPGWRELIVLGKIWHLEQKRNANDEPLYDMLIVDAPATGHGLSFLDVPRVVQQAVQAGPLARHASWVEEMVHDRKRTLLLPVTLPEELPVSETAELVERARKDIDIAVDRIIVNKLPSVPAEGLDAALRQLPPESTFECLPPIDQLRPLLEHARHRGELARIQRERVSMLCDLPIVDLPIFSDGLEADSEWTGRADLVLEPPVWPNGESGRTAFS